MRQRVADQLERQMNKDIMVVTGIGGIGLAVARRLGSQGCSTLLDGLY